MNWEQRINKLASDWERAINQYNNSNKPLDSYYLMSYNNDFRLIDTGIKEGDLEKVRKGIEEAKIMYPFIREMLTIRDKYPGGCTDYSIANETFNERIVVDIYKGKFRCPKLSWFGKKETQAILLELSRLINHGEARCLKHPRFRKCVAIHL